MCPEAPERVLVGAQLAQVETVRVDVVDVPEIPAAGDLDELVDARVVLEQVADHQDPAGLLRRDRHPLRLGHRLRERLLDETVLACGQHPLRELGVRGHVRGHRHRVEVRVRQQLLDVVRSARARELRRPALARLRRGVADPAQLRVRQAVEVAREVRSPVAETDDSDLDAVRDHRAGV